MTTPARRAKRRTLGFLDRHATILTIIAVAVLVLVPTKIAYDASNSATHAGNKASHAVVRLEDERRSRIYDQNGIDHYFCGKSAAIERVLTLLLTASLQSHHPSELTAAQLRARAVFESVLSELSSTPKCEVLIPPPPKPKHGESSEEAAARNKATHPAPIPLPGLPAPTESQTGSGGTTGHAPTPHPSPTPSPPHEHGHSGSGGAGGHEAPVPVETPAPAPGGSQGSPEATAPPAETQPEKPVAAAPSGSTPITGEIGKGVGGLVTGLCSTVDRIAGLCH